MKLTGTQSSAATAANGRVETLGRCGQCACRDGQDILSRHLTTDGLLTYTRCRCGALHVWLSPLDATAARHIAHGRGARAANRD